MSEAVESGDEEVIIDEEEKRIDHEFIKQVNRRLGCGYKGNLRLADERGDIGGGFVLRRGRIKNNFTFKVLLARARKELEIELAKELFGNPDSQSPAEPQITKHKKRPVRCKI
jgi:vacuolar-type H+-ATPase subunit E/Vma4